MQVLVTGAAGFIGSHLVEKLLEKGHKVIAVDNFSDFYARDIKERNINGYKDLAAVDFHELNIEDEGSIDQAFNGKKIDAIIHLAARAGVRPSIKDPVAYYNTNVNGTQLLLEFAKKNNIKQFIFASSSSVYGINQNYPWSEKDQVLLPISPYAGSKIAGELMGHVYSHLYGIRFIALRFFTVFGPRQRPDLAIHKFFKLVMNGEPVSMYGDGSTRRDYTYVGDIVSGIMAALDYDRSMYEVINLGNSHTVSLKEMIEAVEDALGKKSVIKQMEEQPGDVPITYADISRAKELLGYNPSTPFETGISKFRDWFLELYEKERKQEKAHPTQNQI